jgi:hypothetical protein
MASKTFKIGEYCQGGIITVETKGNNVTIIGKEWDYSKGTRRGSDQSGAKEFCRLEVDAEIGDADRRISEYLNDLTTSYYTDEIMKWIESKTKLNKRMFW